MNLNHRTRGTGLIYSEMSLLAAERKAVDLAQGTPEGIGSKSVLEHAANAFLKDHHKYTASKGPLPLRKALADDAQKRFGTTLDPDQQVVVTSGAQGALACALFGLLEPGDEILIIEPYYNACVDQARLAGATLRFLSLQKPDFHLDEAELIAAMSERTQIILINSPNNPSGYMFSRAELMMLHRACERFDAYLISDEVYEHFVYDGYQHTSVLEIPELANRAIAISSASKTFFITGWRVGWARGAAPLIAVVAEMQALMSFCLPNHLCEGVRFALEELPASYYEDLRANHMAKRDRLCQPLKECGIKVISPQATIFAMIDIRNWGESDDVEFCQRMPAEVGVAAVPVSLSWHDRSWGRHLIRLCFSKTDETIDRGVEAFRFFAERRLGS